MKNTVALMLLLALASIAKGAERVTPVFFSGTGASVQGSGMPSTGIDSTIERCQGSNFCEEGCQNDHEDDECDDFGDDDGEDCGCRHERRISPSAGTSTATSVLVAQGAAVIP